MTKNLRSFLYHGFQLFSILGLTCALIPTLFSQPFTRGLGVYPGNPDEDFSPVVIEADSSYRNLALLRPAYHSSSYDYNLTAQLVTDGLVDTIMPSWISVFSSQQGELPINERQRIIDRHMMTTLPINEAKGWIQINLEGRSHSVQADSINVYGSVLVDKRDALGWECRILGSSDGILWDQIGTLAGEGYPGDSMPKLWRHWVPSNMRIFSFSVVPEKSINYKKFRVEVNAPNVTNWSITELEFFKNGNRQNMGGPYEFTSAWMSGGDGNEWIIVDLGGICTFDKIIMHWINPAQNIVFLSSINGSDWEELKISDGYNPLNNTICFNESVKAKYVKILMNNSTTRGRYILSELEIYGRGGLKTIPKAFPITSNNLRIELAGGAWKIQRASLVEESGEMVSKEGFDHKNWIIATVPGTVLVSYLNTGALPDPDYSDNQLMISESYFWSDFWYRDEFNIPESFKSGRVFLNFDGINWKAKAFLNGYFIGRIEGGFTRKQFDITNMIKPGGKNVLAVKIEKNATPGYPKEHTWNSPDANGGELGRDNPTYHASVGWDWIPTIRGREIGIWNDVYITRSGPVTLHDPFIKPDLPLPDTSFADLTLEVLLKNHSEKKIKGTFRAKIGSIIVEQALELEPNKEQLVRLDHSMIKELRIMNPNLWWPNGYGKQSLYDVELQFITSDNLISDSKRFKTGIREMAYSEEGGILRLWVNGRRFIGRGGNWGFSESNLLYREREYEIAIRYHKEMNFTMIRNWVGQTGDDEFFEACDRNGIMVWQDFWLANPVDGPDPFNDTMFLKNAENFVKRLRNHPSLALYCGRNEGYPPETIDQGLREMLLEIHPGIHYISNSAWDVVSGGGPYRAYSAKYYFEERATQKLHSEMGRPCIVPYESLLLMMPDSLTWPQGRIWGIHDLCLSGAQRASSFIQQMEETFGTIENVKEWVELAQWLNYDGYRAMFEAQSKYRMGLLLWMSHPAWPSLVWQTYDYYFEPTAAYFGCKKASEPLHIQWNPLTDSIEVVNYSNNNGHDLKALMELINLDGSIQLMKTYTLSSPRDSRKSCIRMEYPEQLTKVFFIRVKLFKNGNLISENLYMQGREEGKLNAIREIPDVIIFNTTTIERKENKWYLNTTLKNTSDFPALLVRLKVIKEISNERILPAIYSDNYITLMPEEERSISIEIDHADTGGEKPIVIIEGINVE